MQLLSSSYVNIYPGLASTELVPKVYVKPSSNASYKSLLVKVNTVKFIVPSSFLLTIVYHQYLGVYL
jgi:hypothetical protein